MACEIAIHLTRIPLRDIVFHCQLLSCNDILGLDARY